MKRPSLTVKRLQAIKVALSTMLGEETHIKVSQKDFEAALTWTKAEITRRLGPEHRDAKRHFNNAAAARRLARDHNENTPEYVYWIGVAQREERRGRELERKTADEKKAQELKGRLLTKAPPHENCDCQKCRPWTY